MLIRYTLDKFKKDCVRFNAMRLHYYLPLLVLIACSSPEHNAGLDTSAIVVVGTDSNHPEVRSLIRSLVKQNEDSEAAELRGTLAMVYEANGYWNAAAITYQQAQRLNPADPRWIYHSALLQAQQGYLKEALNEMHRVDGLTDDLVAVHFWLGQWYLELGKLNEARAEFTAACAVIEILACQVGLVQIELRQNHPERAIDLLEAIEATEEHPQLKRLLAQAYLASGRENDANRLRKLTPEATALWWPDPWVEEKSKYARGFGARLNVAEQLIARGHFAEATLVLEELTHQQPSHSGLHYQLGLVYMMTDQQSRAVEAFSSAIDVNSDHYPSHIALAEIYRNVGALDQSIQHLKLAGEIHPKIALPWEQAAKTHLVKQDFLAAGEAIKRAIENDSKDPEIYYFNGLLASQSDLWEVAISQFEHAVALDSTYTAAHVALARSYAELGRFDDASASLVHADRAGAQEAVLAELRIWLNSIKNSPSID